MFKIYYLHRGDGIPFYIGKTKNAVRRIHKHYDNFGYDIFYSIIDEVEDWKFWESYWIEQFKCWGFNLENKNNGGGGPTQWTKEQKESINPKRIIKIINHPTRGNKISKTLKERNHAKYYTQEVREKMSYSQKGKSKPFTQEHIKNLAEANLRNMGNTVECYTIEGELINTFPCLREAKNWLLEKKLIHSPNVDKQIKDCCKGRQKTCHGYKWKYK
jgi:hypothetical protein